MNTCARKFGIVILVTTCVACAADVFFLGLEPGGAPALEETCERLIRENMATAHGVNLFSTIDTRQFMYQNGLERDVVLSSSLVRRLSENFPDSTYLVWGTFQNVTIEKKRRFLFSTVISGSARLTLHIYSIIFRDFAFAGDIDASAQINDRLFWLYPLEHDPVSATKQATISNTLARVCARHTADLIVSLVKTSRREEEGTGEFIGAEQYKVPSISDVFTIPSVEAATIEEDEDKSGDTEEQPPVYESDVNDANPQQSTPGNELE